jgi:hypothetical protein
MALWELTAWQFECDYCRAASEILFSIGGPDLPEGWTNDYNPGRGRLTLCRDCVGRLSIHKAGAVGSRLRR